MAAPLAHEVTQLLKAWTTGDEQALEKLTPLVYEQLHRVAQHYMAGQRPGHVLQTTALQLLLSTRSTCSLLTADK
jgi:hypothetical protein